MKKVISVLLTVSIILSFASFTVFAERGGLTISPNPQSEFLTREAFVKTLWELSGKKIANYIMPFSDVKEGDDFCEAIRFAASEKIVQGYGDNKFGPKDYITREEFATIIYNFVKKYDLGFKGAWMFHLGFKDLNEVSDWASEPIYYMVASKFFDGNAEKVLPKDKITVSEAEETVEKLKTMFEQKNIKF